MPETQSKNIRQTIEYILVRTLLAALNVLPFKRRIKLGGIIVGLLIKRLKNTRKRIKNNFLKVYPDTSGAKLDEISGEIGKNFGRTFTEILNNDDYSTQLDLMHAFGPGLEILREAHANNSGAIIVSGHFGQWEAARHVLKSEGIEVGAISQPSANAHFNKIFTPQVENAGKPIFTPDQRGTLEMVRHIRSGGIVAILLDQRYNKGETLDFMGLPAKTSTVAASLALKYNIPMVPVYGTRRTDSLDIDIEFEAEIPHTDAITMTQAANDSLAKRVRNNPEQWYWLHNRWNT